VIEMNPMQTLQTLASSMQCAEPEYADVRCIRDIGIAIFEMYSGLEEEENEGGSLLPVILYKSHTESGVAVTLPGICEDFAEVYMFLITEAKNNSGEEYAYHLSGMLVSHARMLVGDKGLERIQSQVSQMSSSMHVEAKKSEKVYH